MTNSKFKLGDLVSWINNKGYTLEGRVSGYGVLGENSNPVILICWDREGCYTVPEERLSAVELVDCGYKPGEVLWYKNECLPGADKVEFIQQNTSRFATVVRLNDFEVMSVSIKNLSRGL